MIRTLPFALCAVLAVSGCASRFNPLNWWGNGAAGPADVTASPETSVTLSETTALPLIAQLSKAQVVSIPGGRLISATGIAAAQQYHSAELVQVASDEAGTLVFDFVALPPDRQTRVGSAASREITVATKLTTQALSGVRRIQIRSAGNASTLRP